MSDLLSDEAFEHYARILLQVVIDHPDWDLGIYPPPPGRPAHQKELPSNMPCMLLERAIRTWNKPASSALPGAGSHNKYLGLALFPKPVFGLAALASTGPVLLMEGPINAMIANYWGFNAVALTGTNPSPAHLEEIETRIVNQHRRLVPVSDNDEAGSVAIVKWREFIPQMEEPILLPAEVDGRLIKDLNDLHVTTEKGRQLFVHLLKKRRLV